VHYKPNIEHTRIGDKLVTLLEQHLNVWNLSEGKPKMTFNTLCNLDY